MSTATLPDTLIQERTEWFDNLIATLRTHELQLDTNSAPRELVDFYRNLISNNLDDILKTNKALTQKHFVSKIVFEFIKLLDKDIPNKLAFSFNDAEVLVWAEIDDNSEQQEKKLTRAESKINAQFHNFGFDMETIIVEKSDNLPIPNHYKIFKS